MALQPQGSTSQDMTACLFANPSPEAQQLALLQQVLSLQALSAESLQEEASKASAIWRSTEAQLRSALHALEEENRALQARAIQAEARTQEVQWAREVETLASAQLVHTLQTEVRGQADQILQQAAHIRKLEAAFHAIQGECDTMPYCNYPIRCQGDITRRIHHRAVHSHRVYETCVAQLKAVREQEQSG